LDIKDEFSESWVIFTLRRYVCMEKFGSARWTGIVLCESLRNGGLEPLPNTFRVKNVTWEGICCSA